MKIKRMHRKTPCCEYTVSSEETRGSAPMLTFLASPSDKGRALGPLSTPLRPPLTSAAATEEFPERLDASSPGQVHRDSPEVAESQHPGKWGASGTHATVVDLTCVLEFLTGGAELQLPTVVDSSAMCPSLPFPSSWSLPAQVLNRAFWAHFPNTLPDSSSCSRLYFGEEAKTPKLTSTFAPFLPLSCFYTQPATYLTLFIVCRWGLSNISALSM